VIEAMRCPVGTAASCYFGRWLSSRSQCIGPNQCRSSNHAGLQDLSWVLIFDAVLRVF